MTADEVRRALKALLHPIAPEADLDALDPSANLREELDIDSMDFLKFTIRIQEGLGVEVPEADYGRLSTLDGCVDYVAESTARIAAGKTNSASGRSPPGMG
jgi:acyl carrier protein